MGLVGYLDVVQRTHRVSNDGTFICGRVYRSLAFQKAPECLNFSICWLCSRPHESPATWWVGVLEDRLDMWISLPECERGENSFGVHPAKLLHSTSMMGSSLLVRFLELGRPARGFTSLVIRCQLPARICVKLCMAIWASSHLNGIPLCQQRKTKRLTVMPSIV